MAILATTNSTPRELVPAGNYIARCYQMIQVGTVNELINGENKLLQKVRIGWEFPNDLKVFSEEKGPQPIVFNEEYTLSMGEKANLRKMLASWRGKDFSFDEAKSFDITALLGKSCMVNIIHKPTKADPTKVYAKIGSVSSVPKGMEVPPQINTTFVLSYDNFSFEKFNSLPDFIKEKMKTSAEFVALNVTAPPPPKSIHADGLPAPVRNELGSLDELPF
jgi:hypothetical protein